jgi:PadR family transcriptional regulator, regulatory protein PadR
VARDVNDLLYGSLDMLVLKALAWGPRHGYTIAQWIEDRTKGELAIVDVALYKALHRLESAGAVDAEWGVSANNRRAKYYSLTATGRRALTAEAAVWRRYAAAVGAVLDSAEA